MSTRKKARKTGAIWDETPVFGSWCQPKCSVINVDVLPTERIQTQQSIS